MDHVVNILGFMNHMFFGDTINSAITIVAQKQPLTNKWDKTLPKSTTAHVWPMNHSVLTINKDRD